jgi:hypothetical protein
MIHPVGFAMTSHEKQRDTEQRRILPTLAESGSRAGNLEPELVCGICTETAWKRLRLSLADAKVGHRTLGSDF